MLLCFFVGNLLAGTCFLIHIYNIHQRIKCQPDDVMHFCHISFTAFKCWLCAFSNCFNSHILRWKWNGNSHSFKTYEYYSVLSFFAHSFSSLGSPSPSQFLLAAVCSKFIFTSFTAYQRWTKWNFLVHRQNYVRMKGEFLSYFRNCWKNGFYRDEYGYTADSNESPLLKFNHLVKDLNLWAFFNP